MNLKQNIDVESFRAAIRACNGDVFLKSSEGDVFNLKSSLSEYIALGRLLHERSGKLELYANNREDMMLLRPFIQDEE